MHAAKASIAAQIFGSSSMARPMTSSMRLTRCEPRPRMLQRSQAGRLVDRRNVAIGHVTRRLALAARPRIIANGQRAVSTSDRSSASLAVVMNHDVLVPVAEHVG